MFGQLFRASGCVVVHPGRVLETSRKYESFFLFSLIANTATGSCLLASTRRSRESSRSLSLIMPVCLSCSFPVLAFIFPQIAHELRARATEVAFGEWTDSLYENIDKTSYHGEALDLNNFSHAVHLYPFMITSPLIFVL